MNKIITGLLASTLLLSSISSGIMSSQALDLVSSQTQTLSSGTCGTNAYWTYDANSATLTIRGTGAMDNYTNYAAPWVAYREKIQTVIIEEGITTVGWSAFHGCWGLSAVYLPNTIVSLEYGAFAFCTALSHIYLPESLKCIGIAALADCYSLTKLTVPQGCTHIEDSAFLNCTGLQTLVLPSSMTYIGASAFRNCPALSQVHYQGTLSNRYQISTNSMYNSSFTGAYWSYQNYSAETPPTVPTVTVPDPEPVAPPSFPDWALQYINFVSEKIMPDISVTNYDSATSRGVTAQTIYNMYGNGNVAGLHSFSDAGDFELAISWCYHNSVMSGHNDNFFDTYSGVTRQEFALILQKLASTVGKMSQSAELSVLNSYLDQGEISVWARDGVAWAVSNGLMSGNENKLNPTEQISRVEMAVMLYQFNQK